MSAENQIFNVVLGTAGHIDHGKSSLVQALTGIHPDRLKEEQDRGITIDLGFAPLVLKDGLRVGIIDVPGHEKFIKNMVAGATGVDFVMMIVAADDGIMEQTREHLQIVQLLGVHDGLTVITKKDLVEPELLELVEDEVRNLVKGTLLDNKPVLRVSSKTGEGIPELKGVLEERLSQLARREAGGPFRMPVQRVFAKEGFGTVLTGVPLSGQVSIGDNLEVLPPGYSGRVKGLHAYKMVISHGQAGHSTAINLHGPGIDKREVIRGMVVATPGVFTPVKMLTARLTHLSSAPRPLKHRAPVRFHAGTAEIQGKVLLLDAEQVAPGQDAWIQILLEEPTVAAPGDHYILRHQTPMTTLGGGRIVDVSGAKLKRQDADVLKSLQTRLDVLDRPPALLEQALAAATAPLTLPQLCSQTAQLPHDALGHLEKLIQGKKAMALKPASVFVAASTLDQLLKETLNCLYAYFKEHPGLKTVELPEWRQRVQRALPAEAAAYFDEFLALLKGRGQVVVESNAAALPGRELKLDGALAKHAQHIEEALKAGGLAPPPLAELEAQLKLPPKTAKEIRRYLIDTGKIVEASPDVHFHCTHYEAARSEVQKLFATKPELTASEIRQHLNMNRKYVIPLVELFDKRQVTRRDGDKRRLAT
ncbi:MAG TPA: selenocysteine-specific translation elongation factor [Planctomycetota bacterium]|nr:selenocysteine-specific translation elongation factor [Planctomycetota bacterium]